MKYAASSQKSPSTSIATVSGSKLRIFLADDHAILREGIKSLVNTRSCMEVVGEADNGAVAIQQARELRPDIIVMDISMPNMDGAQATEAIKQVCPEIKILILTIQQDADYIRSLLKKGASGYVLKSAVKDELVNAILHIAKGGIYLDQNLTGLLVQSYSHNTTLGAKDESVLSERELEVLRLVAWGYSNREIAQQLRVGVRSVETYKSRMMEKLDFKNRAEVVSYAVQRGWLRNS